jgi:hypothetical protein
MGAHNYSLQVSKALPAMSAVLVAALPRSQTWKRQP